MKHLSREQQKQLLAQIDDMIAKAHDMLVDIFESREAAGESIPGDALWTVQTHLDTAIRTLRDSGESPDYYPAWECSLRRKRL